MEDPIAAVAAWVADADADPSLREPRAMQLATVSTDGQPSVRTVLLRGLDERGFFFVTNLESTKGRDLAVEPRCGLVLVWTPLLRQVCVTGTAERVEAAETEAYWRTRPRGSRIGAWASPQSRPIAGREALERAVADVEARFDGIEDIPVPPFWGGWRVVPSTIELWTGRPNRLHDRIRFRRAGAGWIQERLAP